MNPPQFSPKSRRALLLGAIFLFINGFFVARVEEATRPELAGVSAAFVLVLWFPSLLAAKNWLGSKRAALLLAALGVFAIAIETFAVKTGLPYGQFSYGDKIGAKLFGVVPWTVPFSWPPLVLGAMALAARIAPKRPIIAGTLILLTFDLVLDPGAVQQEFWTFKAGGLYYGVPFSNFCGWIVSGLIGSWIFACVSSGHKIRIPNVSDSAEPPISSPTEIPNDYEHTVTSATSTSAPLPLVSSVTLILAFWTSVTLFVGLWVPAIVGITLLRWIWREVATRT